MARRVLTGHAMPLQSFVVRKLSKTGSPDFEQRESRQYLDGFGNGAAYAGAVYEISAVELRLSAEQIVARLEARQLQTTDLILLGGTWTTLAESPPFFEIAEPYARRERRLRDLKSALILFVSVAVSALFFAIRVFC